MWELYDALIQGIPEEWIAEEIVRGTAFSYVKSGSGIGMGGALNYDFRMPMFSKNMEGLPLREVAECIKSWNFYEAAVGLAAINAYYNNLEVVEKAGILFNRFKYAEDRINDPFIMSQNEIRGKKVTVVGHFPFLETLFAPYCDIRTIAGEIPRDDDYPTSAADYLLPQSDFVFLSSSCFIDKTLPRYLELSKNAKKVTIVGPSTILSPVLFNYGVFDLSGFVIKDFNKARRIIRGAENGKIYATGQKVSFKRPCD